MLFYEKPTIEISGKRFIVHNRNWVLGPHRAEASSLELTDASLSTALILNGGYGDDGRGVGKTTQQQEQPAGEVGNIEGADGKNRGNDLVDTTSSPCGISVSTNNNNSITFDGTSY